MTMSKNGTERTSYTLGLHYQLNEAARISELMARNFYKNYVRGSKSILELDEFKILSHILENPELSQSDIAKLVYKGKAHIGKILSEMEKKGYITRNISTHNNIMVKRTALTEMGEKLYHETDIAFKKLADDTLAEFSKEEIDIFLHLLDKFKTQMLARNEITF